jgi:hypothetical protein
MLSAHTSTAMIGTPALWATSISARKTELWNSPVIATTFSWEISRSAAAVPSSGLPRVSAKTTWICRPSTPPLALISSAASWAACFINVPSA